MTATDPFPCHFDHPRNLDWTARVLELQGEMTNSDAQGVADIEFSQGKLPVYPQGSKWNEAAREYISWLQRHA